MIPLSDLDFYYDQKALKEIVDEIPILQIKTETLNGLARIGTIGELIFLSEGKEIEGVNNEKLFNKETIEVANFIIDKIEEILQKSPIDIKNVKIKTIVGKIGNKLKDNGTLSGFLLGTHILSTLNKISSIYLRYKSIHKNGEDYLTGLKKISQIDLDVENAIKNKEKNGINFGLTIIHIDFFKELNNSYGILIGNIILKEVASILKKTIRNKDIVCRGLGGDFAILLHGGNIKNYYSITERIKKDIHTNLKKSINKKIIENNGNKIIEDITISIGVTEMEKGDSKDSLFERANKSLYEAKEGEKNYTIIN